MLQVVITAVVMIWSYSVLNEPNDEIEKKQKKLDEPFLNHSFAR